MFKIGAKTTTHPLPPSPPLPRPPPPRRRRRRLLSDPGFICFVSMLNG
jgi:hypothetical protein